MAEAFASDTDDIATAKVHRWLAFDQGHGPAAIAAEVEEWDETSLSPVYAMARCLLLRRDDQALVLLRRLLTEGTIDRTALALWPLFDRVREAGLLDDLIGE